MFLSDVDDYWIFHDNWIVGFGVVWWACWGAERGVGLKGNTYREKKAKKQSHCPKFRKCMYHIILSVGICDELFGTLMKHARSIGVNILVDQIYHNIMQFLINLFHKNVYLQKFPVTQ